MLKRVELGISGVVQGVGFRYSALSKAKRLNLTGWVKNDPNSKVFVLAEGDEGDLKDFIDFCYNGISFARVQKIDQSWSKPTGEFSDFTIKY